MRVAWPSLCHATWALLSAALGLALVATASSQQSASSPSVPQQKPGAPSEKPSSTPAPGGPAEKHSTPEERQRLVTIAHKLEAAPLDPSLASDRDWAIQWAVAAPDVHVKICPSLLADLRRPKYKYRTELTNQLLISSAAFLIEHQEHETNISDQSVGGIEGVLKAYSAILKADPQATAKSLDELLQKQKEGKLEGTVREMVKDCR